MLSYNTQFVMNGFCIRLQSYIFDPWIVKNIGFAFLFIKWRDFLYFQIIC